MTLTRSQTAHRLGRSIATVRKLEGLGYLSPRFGERGKRLFDVDQVETVAQRLDQTGQALPERGAQGETPVLTSAALSTGELRGRVAELEARNRALANEMREVRESMLDAVEKLLSLIARRCPSALEPLERLLALASKED